jgi:phosphoribosylaminoimidazole carboxylase PurE protein
MGSAADEGHAKKIYAAARDLGLSAVMRVGSAHKTAEHVTRIIKDYESDPRPKVYITIAGRSNALSGFTDGLVLSPVIACPPPGDAFGGADLYSSLRMPSGIAPAVVLEPVNAALLAAKILGLSDQKIRDKVREYQRSQADKVVNADHDLVQSQHGEGEEW